MTCCENGLPLGIKVPLRSLQITVATYNLFLVRIPYDELLVAVLAGVELVNVDLLAGASSCLTESYLAQTAYLSHHIGCVVGRDNIDLVVAFVGHAEL